MRLQTILFALDFSEFSRQALAYGVGLARRFNALLYVLHALPQGDDFPEAPVPAPDRTRELKAEEASETIFQWMRRYSVPWEAVVARGLPAEAIVRTAERNNVDLVVTASYGFSTWKRWLLGSVVEQLFSRLHCPLWVVRPPPFAAALGDGPLRFRRILAGCNLKEEQGSKKSPVLLAGRLARAFRADLHLVHCAEHPLDEEGEEEGPYESVQRSHMEKWRRELKELAPADSLPKGKIELVVLQGVPAEELPRYAARMRADLTVVGAPPHRELQKKLAGSTTRAMLRSSPCPVLVAPPERALP